MHSRNSFTTLLLALAALSPFVVLAQSEQKAGRYGAVQQRLAPLPPEVLHEISTVRAEVLASQRFVPPAPAVAPSVSATPSKTPVDGSKAPPTSPEVVRLLEQARHTESTASWSQAAASYASVESAALAAGERHVAADAALEQARILQTAIQLDPKQGTHHDRVIEKFRSALANAAPLQEGKIRNNLGVFYLQSRQPDHAITVFRDMDWTVLTPIEAPLCRFNFGRAAELAGDDSLALRQYQLAISLQPELRPALEGAGRLLIKKRDAAGLIQMAEMLIEKREATLAAGQLWAGMRDFAETPEAPQLVTLLVRTYVAAHVTPLEYQEKEQQKLAELAEKTVSVRSLVHEVDDAFLVRLPPLFDHAALSRAFSSWNRTEEQRNLMSQLLKNVGDFHARNTDREGRGQPEALACYVAAWTLNSANTDAALYASSLLQEHRDRLDPKGERVRVLVQQLFEAKGLAYSIPVKTNADLFNLMRLHFVLGTIFEQRKAWGSEQEVESVIFQLSRAVAIEAQLRKDDPQFLPSPDLYVRLAKAFRAAGRMNEAHGFYLKSAEGFLFFDKAKEATDAVKSALELGITPSEDAKIRLDALRVRTVGLGTMA